MENKKETITMGYIGYIGIILGYIGIMEKKMKATIGLGFQTFKTEGWQKESFPYHHMRDRNLSLWSKGF